MGSARSSWKASHRDEQPPAEPPVAPMRVLSRFQSAALERIVSQFYEGGATGGPDDVPDDPKAQAERKEKVRQALLGRDRATARQYRDKLAELYGKDPSGKVEFAEAFEVCEYGRQPDAAELRRLFPFFEK